MKATRSEQVTTFKPVVLTLETQHEVDAIYAVLNNSRLSEALSLNNGSYRALIDFANPDEAYRLHKSIEKIWS